MNLRHVSNRKKKKKNQKNKKRKEKEVNTVGAWRWILRVFLKAHFMNFHLSVFSLFWTLKLYNLFSFIPI